MFDRLDRLHGSRIADTHDALTLHETTGEQSYLEQARSWAEIADRHYWVGALVVGVLELVVALLLVKRGLGALKEPSYTLEESRDELRETVTWAKNARAH